MTSTSPEAGKCAPTSGAPAEAANGRSTGASLAIGVAALFVAACQQRAAQDAPSQSAESAGGQAAGQQSMPAPPDPKSGNVQCIGIHECKGKSACHVIGSHACAGQNTCKGKGWIAVPAAECQSKGGKALDS